MKELRSTLPHVIGQALAADLTPLRDYLFSNPSEPLVATGSGGAETAADFAALLYGARGGMSAAVSPYTLHSYSDTALRTGKLFLLSKGGHNNDIVFAARRGLQVNADRTAALCFSAGERNEARKLFLRAGSGRCYVVPMEGVRDGFVSTGTSLAYFALLTRLFQDGADLQKYSVLPEAPFTVCLNDGTPLTAEDLRAVRHYVILHGSWGRPVAHNLEGKLVECGLCGATVCDYRNYCHGRFIHTSNHLEDSAVVLLVSPRERDLAGRIRAFLPGNVKLVVIETGCDAPEASLDLLIRATAFYQELCTSCGVDPMSPSNPGRIDKRRPMWVPFMAEMKARGPLTLSGGQSPTLSQGL